MTTRKQLKRGASRNSECVFVGAWLPNTMVKALDEVVVALDTDRSKVIRDALREKFLKMEATR